jgi:uncharacterized membrane-anchored protein YjiN (DUF445 family)
MAMIKSALELALEKTKDLKVDPAAIEAAELRQEGKKLAGLFLDDPSSVDLGKKISACPKDKRASLKQGMLEVLQAQIQLPTNENAAEKLERLAAGYVALSEGAGLLGGPLGGAMAEKKIQAIFQQLAAFFKQYIDDMKNVEQAIKKQWAPKLREKERQMAARLGQDVRLDPMMDPEFSAFYKQNVGALRQQYEAALAKAKAELASILGIETK